jgi:hypothetical protein
MADRFCVPRIVNAPDRSHGHLFHCPLAHNLAVAPRGPGRRASVRGGPEPQRCRTSVRGALQAADTANRAWAFRCPHKRTHAVVDRFGHAAMLVRTRTFSQRAAMTCSQAAETSVTYSLGDVGPLTFSSRSESELTRRAGRAKDMGALRETWSDIELSVRREVGARGSRYLTRASARVPLHRGTGRSGSSPAWPRLGASAAMTPMRAWFDLPFRTRGGGQA